MALTEIKTSGIADDAVTTDKLANAINTERTANTAKVQTTINNNADNRIITGSGTANTLNGESKLTFDGNSNLTLDAVVTVDRVINATDSADPWLKGVNSSNTETAYIKPDGQAYLAGKVGVGTTAPLKTLTTKASSNTHAFYIAANDNDNNGWGFQADSSSGNLRLDRSIGNDFNYRRICFHGDGGIAFQGDTAAANALDDYEEGLWTPSLDGTTYGGNSYGYQSQSGYYTKVGKQVTCHFYLAWNNFNGTGAISINGLPFSVWNQTSLQTAGAVMTNNLNWPNDYTSPVTHNWSNTSYFRIYVSKDNDGWAAVQCDGAGSIIGTITYLAN